MDYDEYGNVIYDSNPDFQPFAYASGLYDTQTKLIKFGARDYDASCGRWIMKDPIGFKNGRCNLYNYCSNNPINTIDPTGLKEFTGDKITRDPRIREVFNAMWCAAGEGRKRVEAGVYIKPRWQGGGEYTTTEIDVQEQTVGAHVDLKVEDY